MDKPQPKFRKDYQPPSFWIDTVDLRFELEEDRTDVESVVRFRRNAEGPKRPLVLDAEAMEILEVRVDDRVLADSAYTLEDDRLTLADVPDAFTLTTRVRIHPEKNTALSGLYRSSGNFCTQCEAEGFRRITPFLDRPDVMATFTTTIVGDKSKIPVMLSNGNRVEEGELEDGRSWVKWEDPFKKPSYLFALVAGDLRAHPGEFVTKSGRKVKLEIWVEPQNIDKCEHALASLQRSMKWDEDTFGLEYDLDIYMIVAVGDFNMGAMENKGLNVFNSKYVLARPDTATDDDYENIEGVIGHEYFHNWTGNRVTCRDWFQLTLKEGLTVFRDQQFTADMTSKAVKRISDVQSLRTAQFEEDAGPMAHPIRPEQYIEMNNFYTATVYVKGAEVIRMYHTLLGAEGFRKGMDLYFERHDGDAVTCDDFRAAMADANGVDLSQFERWYAQPGTPVVHAQGHWDESAGTYALQLKQSRPALNGDDRFEPMHVPVTVGLIGVDGSDLEVSVDGVKNTEHVLELKESEQSFVFEGVAERPVPSVLRHFSAPVRLEMERGRDELAFLLGHDSDAFNRWEAGQKLAEGIILELVRDHQEGRALEVDPKFVEAWGRVLADEELDGSLKAQALSLPYERVIAQKMSVIDPDGIHAAREHVVCELARAHGAQLRAAYDQNRAEGPYQNDRASIAGRRIKNCALRYLSSTGEADALGLAAKQLEIANNMTDAQAALVYLNEHEGAARNEANATFYTKYKEDPLVIDKWFGVQAMSGLPSTIDRVLELSKHPDFTMKNPNRVRSLVGAFCAGNQVRFHGKDGRGYRFLADRVLELDPMNPQVAARLVGTFNSWKRFGDERQALIKAELERIVGREGLSKDVFEIVSRALA